MTLIMYKLTNRPIFNFLRHRDAINFSDKDKVAAQIIRTIYTETEK